MCNWDVDCPYSGGQLEMRGKALFIDFKKTTVLYSFFFFFFFFFILRQMDKNKA